MCDCFSIHTYHFPYLTRCSIYCYTRILMRILITTLACLYTFTALGLDTTARKPVYLYPAVQMEIGAAAGFVFPGAAESTLPYAKAFRAGMFLFHGSAHFNRHNRSLYFTTGFQVGLMPFSTLGTIPAALPPHKPLAEFRNNYLVASIALIPGAQVQVPVSKSAKFCAGVGAGPMIQVHRYITGVQENVLLQANIGLMTEDMTGIGIRFYRPYNGLLEKTAYYRNSYMLTGILLDFRQRLTKPRKKK